MGLSLDLQGEGQDAKLRGMRSHWKQISTQKGHERCMDAGQYRHDGPERLLTPWCECGRIPQGQEREWDAEQCGSGPGHRAMSRSLWALKHESQTRRRKLGSPGSVGQGSGGGVLGVEPYAVSSSSRHLAHDSGILEDTGTLCTVTSSVGSRVMTLPRGHRMGVLLRSAYRLALVFFSTQRRWPAWEERQHLAPV